MSKTVALATRDTSAGFEQWFGSQTDKYKIFIYKSIIWSKYVISHLSITLWITLRFLPPYAFLVFAKSSYTKNRTKKE